jgi:hypothetical protein
MPAKSAKQKQLMDAAAHNPAFAKKVGIPQSVAMDFSKASKGKKFQKGGETMKKSAKAMPFKGMETMMEEKVEKKAGKKPAKKYAHGGAAMRGQGVAKRGFAEGGKVGGGGSQEVQVRGVGAARARTAKIC